jgi:hypothetical protein
VAKPARVTFIHRPFGFSNLSGFTVLTHFRFIAPGFSRAQSQNAGLKAAAA